jgi:AP2 domain
MSLSDIQWSLGPPGCGWQSATDLQPQTGEEASSSRDTKRGETMAKVKLAGSVHRRSNGRWTAHTPTAYDATTGRRRRISLGTFATQQEARDALQAFHQRRGSSGFGLTDVETRRMTLDFYLRHWLAIVDSQVRSRALAIRTRSGYESAVRLHICPMIGSIRVGELMVKNVK